MLTRRRAVGVMEMKLLKWIGLAGLGTGLVFQLGGCGWYELLGAALIGLALTGGLGGA